MILFFFCLYILLKSMLSGLSLPTLLSKIRQVDLWTGLDRLLVSPVARARIDVVIVIAADEGTVAVIKKCFGPSSGSTVVSRHRLCFFLSLVSLLKHFVVSIPAFLQIDLFLVVASTERGLPFIVGI